MSRTRWIAITGSLLTFAVAGYLVASAGTATSPPPASALIAAPGHFESHPVVAPAAETPRVVKPQVRKVERPALALGAHGRHVRILEERLSELNYYLIDIDNVFDQPTADAVMAFHKVQGMDRVASVTRATWRALDDPRIPEARGQGPGSHIEVDQTRQVFYAVDDGAITNIIMASTGADGLTEDGRFHIYKRGGYGREYYPSYFDGARAFHAWPDVPTYAASHGCVRLPFWAAPWYWEHTGVGTDVLIYHS
jgi:hypothetical protein